MDNEIKDGGPAFPCDYYTGSFAHMNKGMSLREYFAAHAPITPIDANQSLLQNPEVSRFANPDVDGAMPMALIMKELVRLRWEYADAMLAAMETRG